MKTTTRRRGRCDDDAVDDDDDDLTKTWFDDDDNISATREGFMEERTSKTSVSKHFFPGCNTQMLDFPVLVRGRRLCH